MLKENQVENEVKVTEGFQRQIGTTVYQVNVFFDKETEDSFEDRLLHLLKNDLLIRNDRSQIRLHLRAYSKKLL